jgi:hypothetical protein
MHHVHLENIIGIAPIIDLVTYLVRSIRVN